MHVDPVLYHETSHSFQSLWLDGVLRDVDRGIAVLADRCGSGMDLEKSSQKLINLEKAFCDGVKRLNTGVFR
ncbi:MULTISPECIES: hypothetical protein [unclassified Endozoicomonas]|uniref:hypothetical protein n=1 Tax=unclassified Endozoicomonas TaxID=2644528 RepID=UPI003BB70CF6